MKRKSTLIVLFVFFITSIYAQEKLWEKDLKTELYEVGWIKQANSGIIVAAGAKGLLGMDHVSGKTLWHNKELKGVDKNSFFNIDGLPLFYVEYAPVIGKIRGIIVNSSNGDIVFDTKDEGYRVKNYTTVPDKGIILFELLKAKTRILMSFSLKTWQRTWQCSLGEISGGLIGKVFSRSFIDHGPYFNASGHVIVGIKDNIYTIERENGNIIWNHTTNKKIKALVFSEINNSLYVGVRKSKKLLVLDPEKGNDITPGKLKLRGTLIDITSDIEGNLILVETEGFNIIDPKTNTFKWKKSFKIPFLDEVIPHEKGFIAIGKSDKDGSVALVDKKGGKIWSSNVKGYAYFVVPIPKGVFYISTERSNILDFEKGKDVWKKDVKFKAIPAVTFDEKEDKVILFENKKGYKFDLKTGNVNLFAEDVQLEKVKRSTPLVAEYIDGSGYLIHGDQYISLLTPSGQLKYTKYYTPASDIKGLASVAQLGLAIAGVDFDVEGAISNIELLESISAVSSGAYRTSADQTDGKSTESVVAGLYVGSNAENMSTIFEVTKARHTNSKEIKGHKFIVAKVKSETEPTYHKILMVNKKTGKEDAQIKLVDKTPNYVIDEIDSVVFVNEKNRLISAYKF